MKALVVPLIVIIASIAVWHAEAGVKDVLSEYKETALSGKKIHDKRSISLIGPLLNGLTNLGSLAGGSLGSSGNYGAVGGTGGGLMGLIGSLLNSGMGVSFGQDGINMNLKSTPVSDSYGSGTANNYDRSQQSGSGIGLNFDLTRLGRNLVNGYRAGKIVTSSNGGGGLLSSLFGGLTGGSSGGDNQEMYGDRQSARPGMNFEFPKPLVPPARSKVPPPPPQNSPYPPPPHPMHVLMPSPHPHMPYQHHVSNDHEVHPPSPVHERPVELPSNSVHEKPTHENNFEGHYMVDMSTMEPGRPNRPNYSTEEPVIKTTRRPNKNKENHSKNNAGRQASFEDDSDMPSSSDHTTSTGKFHKDSHRDSYRNGQETQNNYVTSGIVLEHPSSYHDIPEINPSSFPDAVYGTNGEHAGESLQIPVSSGFTVSEGYNQASDLGVNPTSATYQDNYSNGGYAEGESKVIQDVTGTSSSQDVGAPSSGNPSYNFDGNGYERHLNNNERDGYGNFDQRSSDIYQGQ